MNGVAFVAVNYHGAASVPALLDALRAQTEGAWSLTVVDNSEEPAEVRRLRATLDADARAGVVAAPANLGYFGGAAWWWDRTDTGPAEWTVVCNVDVEPDVDFVERLVAGDRGQHVTAPAVTAEPGGRAQNPYLAQRPSAAAMLGRALVYRTSLSARLYTHAARLKARARRPAPPGPAREVYAAHGSILPIHRRYFEAGGDLSHRPFLFGEEVTVAERVRRLGGTIRFDPAVRVVHREHQATGAASRARMLRLQREATVDGYRLVRGR